MPILFNPEHHLRQALLGREHTLVRHSHYLIGLQTTGFSGFELRYKLCIRRIWSGMLWPIISRTILLNTENAHVCNASAGFGVKPFWCSQVAPESSKYFSAGSFLLASANFLSTTLLKTVHFLFCIEWKLIVVQIFHYSTAIFIVIQATANPHRSELKIMSSRKLLNQLYEFALPVNCWFDSSIETITNIEPKQL